MTLKECYASCRLLHKPMYCLKECTSNKPKPPVTSMRSLINRATGCPYQHIHVRDARLEPISRSQLNTFLAYDKTDREKYIKDRFDCDDSALRLQWMARRYFFERGINVAFAMLEGPIRADLHRMNGVVLKNYTFDIVEPQNDKVYRVKDYLVGAPTLVDM